MGWFYLRLIKVKGLALFVGRVGPWRFTLSIDRHRGTRRDARGRWQHLEGPLE